MEGFAEKKKKNLMIMQETEQNPKAGGGVAVAVSKDKNSKYAVKWALEKSGLKVDRLILIHVRPPVDTIPTPIGSFIPVSQVCSDAVNVYMQEIKSKTKSLLRPLQQLCKSKQVPTEIVVLEDDNIPKAIVKYITDSSISNLVIGSSSRNAITRTFRGQNNAANVARKAPKFCSVYVISKGKLASVHSNTSSVQDCDSNDNPRGHSRVNSQDTIVSREMVEETSSDSSGSTAFQSKDLLVQRDQALSCDNQTLYQSLQNSASNVLVDDEPISMSQSIGTIMHNTPTDSIIQIKDANEAVTYSESSISSFSRSSGATGEEFQSSSSAHSDAELVTTCGHKNEMETNRKTDNLSFMNREREHEVHENKLEKLFVEKEKDIKASPNSLPDIETQLKRLKIEIKSTQEMYRESLTHRIDEKKNAESLNAQLIEELREVEEVNSREELAMAVEAEYIVQREGDMEDTETERHSTVKEVQQRKDAELRAIRDSHGRKKAQDALQSAEERYRKYSIEEIEKATDSFSESLKIGEGGYGPVYKGSLDHTAVAIKVLKTDAERGRHEFQQEVEILSRIHHPHMVMLLGTCPERGCLVYEYMANGSLDDCLFRTGTNASLPWFVRFRIASEIASALNFLHTTKPVPIVHRDLKPANILLDQNFVSKIGDVGLARLVPPTVSSAVTEYKNTILGGTFFYIDPEYQRTGILRPKSDVYALGMILLQLLTAKPAMALADKVETAIKNGSMREILDNSAGDWPFEEAVDLAKLGLKCTELRCRDRPDLEKVVLPELVRFRDVANAYVQRSKMQRAIAPPSYFLCPILQEVMEDPYIAADGVTYEYKAIKAWLDKHKSPPMGNPKLPQKKLVRNQSLRSAILEWRIRNNVHPLSQLQRKLSHLKNQGQA
ncbi:hypothetical protein SUGI_0917420 [Cryptomeria japonica]|uniref:U-box domain-containing protein 35 isoform X2 n=1 Tax=Cryptomeria japonica TaxID=3369 RepID=UPI0024149D3E|nr:U-box domain-containing protein 35 isoform X2 [Cryptomeria japonica]GLJ44009.1 hypothetical protein SUGI_0917420 [Cryptomeria japonica]